MALFGFGKKTEEEKKGGCSCGASCSPKETKAAQDGKPCSGIIVLGGGCAKCHELEANVKTALDEMGVDEGVELITDYALIASYGVMSTPALVIGNRVVSCGKVLKKDEIIRLYRENAAQEIS